MKAAKSKGSRAKTVIRDIGEPPALVWKAILAQRPLSLDQCREGASWAFSRMPKSRRALAMFDLLERAYKVAARGKVASRG